MDKKTIILMFIEAIVLVVVMSIIGGCYSKKLKTYEQNLIASKSELNEVKLKNGELLYEKDSYILKIRDLEDELGIRKSEINEIKNKLKSSIAYISKIESQIKIDTVYTVKDSIVYVNNDNVLIEFSYDDKWMNLRGENHILFGHDNKIKKTTTTLYDVTMKTSFTLGIAENYKIFIKTDNPYISVDNIDASVIENSIIAPKKKRFSWGVQLGFGLQYGLINKNLDIGPYGGVGLEWNF